MVDLLFRTFYGATLYMGSDGGLIIASSNERFMSWGMVFCFLAALALASWLFRIRRRLSLAVFGLSMLIPLLVMPSIHAEQIHVMPGRITVDSGVWLFPSRTTIDLNGVRNIEERRTDFRVAGYLVEANAIWTLNRHGGGREKLMLNNFFTAHRVAVAQYLRDRGHLVSR